MHVSRAFFEQLSLFSLWQCFSSHSHLFFQNLSRFIRSSYRGIKQTANRARAEAIVNQEAESTFVFARSALDGVRSEWKSTSNDIDAEPQIPQHIKDLQGQVERSRNELANKADLASNERARMWVRLTDATLQLSRRNFPKVNELLSDESIQTAMSVDSRINYEVERIRCLAALYEAFSDAKSTKSLELMKTALDLFESMGSSEPKTQMEENICRTGYGTLLLIHDKYEEAYEVLTTAYEVALANLRLKGVDTMKRIANYASAADLFGVAAAYTGHFEAGLRVTGNAVHGLDNVQNFQSREQKETILLARSKLNGTRA